MTISPVPVQVVRSQFHKIAQWRAQGIPWSQIGDELKFLNITISTGTLRTLYRQERLRHGSARYVAATQWVTEHRMTIADLLKNGVDWGTIVTIVPPNSASDGTNPKLEMLIEAYNSITERAPAQSTSFPACQLGPASTNHDDPPAPQPIPDPTPVALQSPTNPPTTPQPKAPVSLRNPTPQPVIAQSQEVKGPFTGRMKEYNALFMEADAKRKAEDAKAQRKKEYQKNRKSVFHVKEDPYISVAELRAEYDKWCKIHSERFSLYHEIPDDDESQADLKFEHQRLLDDAEEMTSGYYKLINSRASHRLTNRSKLCVLATAALACGVYVLADTDTPAPPDAITLIGFDRPDSIADLTEIPDPVIIRPEFTQDEIERRDAAYAADEQAGYDSAQVPTSPKRLLAEALILRGAYEFRHNGWIRYDEIVELSGDDIPSPSLCGHPASRTELTLAPPLSPSDPKKDDYPSDHQCDLAREQLKGDWL